MQHPAPAGAAARCDALRGTKRCRRVHAPASSGWAKWMREVGTGRRRSGARRGPVGRGRQHTQAHVRITPLGCCGGRAQPAGACLKLLLGVRVIWVLVRVALQAMSRQDAAQGFAARGRDVHGEAAGSMKRLPAEEDKAYLACCNIVRLLNLRLSCIRWHAQQVVVSCFTDHPRASCGGVGGGGAGGSALSGRQSALTRLHLLMIEVHSNPLLRASSRLDRPQESIALVLEFRRTDPIPSG